MKRVTWVFIMLAACGTDSGTEPTTECTAGETMACECAPNSAGTMTCGADGTFGACGQCATPDPDPARVNFQTEIVPILNRSCGTNNSACHRREAYGATLNMDCRGWLTLENESLGSKFYSGPRNGQSTGCPDKTLYERLTEIDVWQCLNTSVAYVTPGDVSKSYIVNKLNGVNMCRESATSPSVQMPPSDSAFTISAADRALIERWITEGALNN